MCVDKLINLFLEFKNLKSLNIESNIVLFLIQFCESNLNNLNVKLSLTETNLLII